MNRAASILLTTLYAVTLLKTYMPYVNYWMNRSYIISELCENRDKPELECNGKCHLKKEIASSNEQQDDSGAVVSARMMVEFFQPGLMLVLKPVFHQDDIQYGPYSVEPIVGFSRSIFHPPKA